MKKLTGKDIPSLLRKLQGKRTQKQLADDLGITPQYMCDLLKGRRIPGDDICRKIGIERVFVTKGISS